jgi:hypothetical protein
MARLHLDEKAMLIPWYEGVDGVSSASLDRSTIRELSGLRLNGSRDQHIIDDINVDCWTETQPIMVAV